MPPTQPKRKRTRKRKRRAAFSSSSSDSSSSESDDQQECKTLPPPATKPESSSSDSDSESSSSVDSSDEETVRRRPREPVGVSDKRNDSEKLPNRRLSPSPSPPPTELPSFLPRRDQDNTENARMKEEEMKTKFRQFWMASLADGFRDDLEEIRKVCLSHSSRQSANA